MLRRIGLFLLANLLIILTISIVFRIIGLESYLTDSGIDFGSLLVFSFIIGFAGALISLAMSKWMAKMAMRIKVLDPRGSLSPDERRLVERVYALAQRAGLKKMPEVGIYPSGEVNAFATGPSRKNSLVAVSTGLLTSMDDDAVEGVLAHEVAHIANGDMVTMTLLQGVINTFVIFLSRVVSYVVARFVREEMSTMVYFLCTIAFDILFSILGSLVVMAYSRYREFRADRGGAQLAGKEKMVSALQSLKRRQEYVDNSHATVAAFKINGKSNWLRLFSTHPDLDERIRRLQATQF